MLALKAKQSGGKLLPHSDLQGEVFLCRNIAQHTKRDRREGDHWGDLGIDGWIILGWISRRWDVGIWTGLGWPRIETCGGRL